MNFVFVKDVVFFCVDDFSVLNELDVNLLMNNFNLKEL